jgi:hypothetical protein
MVAVDVMGPRGGDRDNPEGYQPCPSGSVTGRTCLADVEPEKVGWLWRGYVPVGKIITLDGDLGKSTVALHTAAKLTVGGQWADGNRCDQPGGVLVMSTDDRAGDTVRPRFGAAGANVPRAHVVDYGITLVDVDQFERHIADLDVGRLIIDVLQEAE